MGCTLKPIELSKLQCKPVSNNVGIKSAKIDLDNNLIYFNDELVGDQVEIVSDKNVHTVTYRSVCGLTSFRGPMMTIKFISDDI